MAQTYSEFKAFVADYIWRQNDTDLANNLDNIIRMANSELNRKLDIQRREVSTTIAPETEDFVLPADFYQILSLTDKSPSSSVSKTNPFHATSKSQIEQYRAYSNSLYTLPYYYTQRRADGATLYLVGPFSSENPGSFDLTYRTAVPDYLAENTSWVEDEYLDLYLYTILKHVGIFLREDERVASYAGLMLDALESALVEDKHKVRFGGSPLQMKPARPVPRRR